ncbi:MAG: ABC transporter permease [Candidatus Pacearchaeota archaeon]
MINLPFKFYSYLKKDALLFLKRRKYLYLSLAVPVLIALIFIMMMGSSEFSIDLAVCDMDDTENSKEILNKMEDFNPIFLGQENCLEKLRNGVRSGKYPAGLEIGEGFEENLRAMNQSKVVVYYDATKPAFSNTVSWRVDSATRPFEKQIIDQLNQKLKERVSSAREGIEVVKGYDLGPVSERVNEIDSDLKKVENMETEFIVNPLWVEERPLGSEKDTKGNSIAFILPIVLIFTLLMLSSTTFIYDRRNNFLSRVKKSTSLSVYFISKLVFFFALGLIQAALVVGLYYAFGETYAINLLNVLHLVLAISLIDTIIGLLIGLVSDNEGVAILFSLIIAFPLMLLSGVFYPLETMPGFVQFIVNVMPLNYQIGIAKNVLLFEKGFSGFYLWFVGAGFILVWWLASRSVDE